LSYQIIGTRLTKACVCLRQKNDYEIRKEIAAVDYLLFLLIILWQVYPDPPRLNDPEPTFDALFI
jgi:hypothetical protein